MKYDINLNGKTVSVEAEPETPLLWVLRDELKLTGTKFGCGVASCGACTVHLDGEPTDVRLPDQRDIVADAFGFKPALGNGQGHTRDRLTAVQTGPLK